MFDFLVGLCFGVCAVLYMPNFTRDENTEFIKSIKFIISECEKKLTRNVKCKVVGVIDNNKLESNSLWKIKKLKKKAA